MGVCAAFWGAPDLAPRDPVTWPLSFPLTPKPELCLSTSEPHTQGQSSSWGRGPLEYRGPRGLAPSPARAEPWPSLTHPKAHRGGSARVPPESESCPGSACSWSQLSRRHPALLSLPFCWETNLLFNCVNLARAFFRRWETRWETSGQVPPLGVGCGRHPNPLPDEKVEGPQQVRGGLPTTLLWPRGHVGVPLLWWALAPLCTAPSSRPPSMQTQCLHHDHPALRHMAIHLTDRGTERFHLE